MAKLKEQKRLLRPGRRGQRHNIRGMTSFVKDFEKNPIPCQDLTPPSFRMKILNSGFCGKQIVSGRALSCGAALRLAAAAAATTFAWIALTVTLLSTCVFAQKNDATAPVVVQPGAPGAPTKVLPPSTKAVLPPKSPADVDFMQGMIMHHSQAVEMTAMIPSHTENKALRELGAKISSSQSDEIKLMKQWLAARGEPVSKLMDDMPGMDMSHDMPLMPGMLTPEQMDALRK